MQRCRTRPHCAAAGSGRWGFLVLPRRERRAGREAGTRYGAIRKRLLAPNDKSIAVLPFVDMSAEKNQEYMSDGIAEELLNLWRRFPT